MKSLHVSFTLPLQIAILLFLQNSINIFPKYDIFNVPFSHIVQFKICSAAIVNAMNSNPMDEFGTDDANNHRSNYTHKIKRNTTTHILSLLSHYK
jgi:hypothetical protein